MNIPKNLPRSEAAVRAALRAHATGANLEEICEAARATEQPPGEAITLEGDTITVETLKLDEVSL